MEYIFKNQNISIDNRVKDLLSLLTLDEKINMLSTHQLPVERLGLKKWLVGTEVARGYVSRDEKQPSTVFPQPIGLASTFDRELMKKLGEIAGNEARVYYQKDENTHLMLWGPTVDMGKDPRWGRNEECYGEDPVLSGDMSAAYTLGMRGEDVSRYRTIPTLKHFCANNNEEDRGFSSSGFDNRTKYEYYYEPFRRAIVYGGAYSVMASYNELNGLPAAINPDLKNVLKDKWGLGFVVTDGGDFAQNVNAHKFSESHSETLAQMIKAGTDVMTDEISVVNAAAYDALKRGFITEKDIDTAVGNSLRGRFMLGEFDDEKSDICKDVDENIVDCDAYREINCRAATECITLLKNDGILPLKKDCGKVALIGNNAAEIKKDWYTGCASYKISLLEKMRKKLGNDRVLYDDGFDRIAIKAADGTYLYVDDENKVHCGYTEITEASTFVKQEYGHGEVVLKSLKNGKYLNTDGIVSAVGETLFKWYVNETVRPEEYFGRTTYKSWNNNELMINTDGYLCAVAPSAMCIEKCFTEEVVSSGAKRAEELAKNCDFIIVCGGNDPMLVARECFDRKTLALPAYQTNLIKTSFNINKNTVLLIISSYPFSINDENETLPAIIYSAHSGAELGNALYDVIFGNVSPSGRTPQTWYKSERDLPSIMDYDILKNDATYLYFKGTPLYPFGYGLSYCNFEYSHFNISQNGDYVNVSVDVQNKGTINGDEIVQIYVSPLDCVIKLPLRKLIGFERVSLSVGEKKTVSLEIPTENFSYFSNEKNDFSVLSGNYHFYAGKDSLNEICGKSIYINAEKLPVRKLDKPVEAFRYDDKYQVITKYAKNEQNFYIQGTGWTPWILLKNVDLNGIKGIIMNCSALAGIAKVSICIDNLYNGEVLCEFEIMPNASPVYFRQIKQTFDKTVEGCHDLYIKFNEGMTLLNLNLF